MNYIKEISSKLGMDKAIAYSSSARIIQGIAGVGSMFFISTFLSGVEQGFYFTFGSILALQVFFELGLTGIMTQFVAHEASHLKLAENKYYQGDVLYKSRLSSLLHFCIKWYLVLAIIVFIFLLVVGFLYFSTYGETQGESVVWTSPWILVSFATALELFISPLTSFLTGLGFVKETSKISFFRQLVVPLCTWLGLSFSFKLYVTGIAHLISVCIWFIFVFQEGLMPILMNLWKTRITVRVSYLKEIFPFQWRIAISWISGYFVFQLFNPVLFATEGAIIAGQMGLTMQALNAIQALSLSWQNTKIPKYSNLISLHKYNDLDILFGKTVKQMSIVSFFLLLGFYLLIFMLKETKFMIFGNVLADRFIDCEALIFLMVPIFIQLFVNSWATYLRCHKKEPMLIISIVSGVFCMLSTLFLGKYYGLYGIVIGYCIVITVLCPWSYMVFNKCKKTWHG